MTEIQTAIFNIEHNLTVSSLNSPNPIITVHFYLAGFKLKICKIKLFKYPTDLIENFRFDLFVYTAD